MTVPQGYSQKLPPNTVCKLTKSIYGLKQDNRQLFEKLTSFLIQLRFKQSHVDTSLFTILHQGTLTFLLVYVEDILLVGKDSAFLNTIKQHLHQKFSIKDLGPIHYYLGIEFRWQWHKGSSLRTFRKCKHFGQQTYSHTNGSNSDTQWHWWLSSSWSLYLQDTSRQTNLLDNHKARPSLCCTSTQPILP